MRPNWFVALKATLTEPLEFPTPPEGMRLLHPEDHHVTVAFFGPLEQDPSPAVAALLETMHHESIEALATGALLLPQEDFASVVALRFSQGEDMLGNYIAQWRTQLLEAVGCAPETRPVLPHMSVARMKPSRAIHLRSERQRWVEHLAERLPVAVHFDHVALYTWRQHYLPNEPRYRIVSAVRLQ